MYTISSLKQQLERHSVTSRAVVEEFLGKIEDPAGEGAKTYLKTYADQARAQADAVDSARKTGRHLPPFAGIPLSIKDLFDIAGETTTAGSNALAANPPAKTDATIVARLRRAGFLLLGKVNMTEFAYSGLGINPHFGTPLSVYDRSIGRIPGGSSSGGAVSVADGMAAGTIGTDTGGSCRIPAAFNGIVGFKPTAKRIPTTGAIPLSTTLDSIGPLTNSVSCAAILDDVMAGGPGADVTPFPIGGLRLGVLKSMVMDGVDETVGAIYAQALKRLSSAGITLIDLDIPEILEIPASNPKGAIVAAEAYAWHRNLLKSRGEYYDSFVKNRVLGGSEISAADYIDMLKLRQVIIDRVNLKTARLDALVLPTVPIIPPTLSELSDSATASKLNSLILGNTSIGNYLDRTAISIPIQQAGMAPVGLMLVGQHGLDRHILSIGKGLEAIFKG